jgi:mRNA interferase MazF
MSLTTGIDRGGITPKRGELYRADPGSAVGHEQAGRRPYLVISVDRFNRGPIGLAVVVPLTTTEWPNSFHIRIEPAESGLPRVSYAMPEMARSLSTLRLERRLGRVPLKVVDTAAQRTGVLIGLGKNR